MSLRSFHEINTFEQWREYMFVLGGTAAREFKYVLLSASEVDLLLRVPHGILPRMLELDPLSLAQLVLLEVGDGRTQRASSTGDSGNWWLFFNPEAAGGGARALHFWVKHASPGLEKELIPDLIHLARNAQMLGIYARRVRGRSVCRA